MLLIDALEALADGARLHMQHGEAGRIFWIERGGGFHKRLTAELGDMLVAHPDVEPDTDALFSDYEPQSFKWRAPDEVA